MAVHLNVNPSAKFTTNMLEAVSLNNEALALGRSGDRAGAERLHKQALQLKEQCHGPDSIQAALSRNALGEVQALQGKFQEADANLRQAVAIRNASGSAFDAAVSRENLAQVLEAQGMFSEAKATRDYGKPDQMSCGNYHCPGQMFSHTQMKQCSRCRVMSSLLRLPELFISSSQCVYYCSQSCQKQDWKSRHKHLCQHTDL